MDTTLFVESIIAGVSLLSWVWLLLGRGFYWRTDQRLDRQPASAIDPTDWPFVSVVVPARNEAESLRHTLPALLNQDYPWPFHVYMVDDCSQDGTGAIANEIAKSTGGPNHLTVIDGAELPVGWSGKIWALHQGIGASVSTNPDYLLLTDADVFHPPDSLRALVARARKEGRDMVSGMVQLRVATFWDRLLIPAFVYYFGKLFPFRWVNDPSKGTAAAAGGCILIKRSTLEGVGGLESISNELIDDCALARSVKNKGGNIWLGLSRERRSLRAYGRLGVVWSMVARTAYTQLNHSPVLLMATVLGMLVVYAVPPMAAVSGIIALVIGLNAGLSWWLTGAGLLAWLIMSWTFVPMLRWYRVSPVISVLLPLTGLLYTLMTLDSARRFWQGKGGLWKGRTFDAVR